MPIGMPSREKMVELVRKAAIARGVSPDVAVSLLNKQGLDLSQAQVQPAGGQMSSGQAMDVRRGGINNIGGNYGGTTVNVGTGSRGNGAGIASIFGSAPGDGPLDYGGVPLATRLMGAGEVFSALGQGRQANPGVLAGVSAAKDAARQRQMAESLYNNLKDTNPVLAEAIRMNPALIDDYIKGEINLNSDKTMAEINHGYRMDEANTERGWKTQDQATDWAHRKEELQLQSDLDPRIREMNMWQAQWKDFIDQSDLGQSSTKEIYRRWTNDPELTDQEAQRLANNNTTRDKLNAEYKSIIDDRGSKKAISAQETAAKMAGIKLKEGEYITNIDEVMAGKPPKVAAAEGSDLYKSQQADITANTKKENDKAFGGDVVVSAIGRLRQSRAKQDAGESWTGAGTTGNLGVVPLPTEAATMQADLNTINARLGFDQLQAMREASPTGAALGPVSDFENRLLRGTIESLTLTNDPKDFDKRLNRLEVIYKGIMTPSSGDTTKSKTQRNIDMLLEDPSPEAQAEFDDYYGPGMADMILNNSARKGPTDPRKKDNRQ